MVLVFNVFVSDSLVNGEVGTVIDIINEKNEIKAVIVKFDNPEAGLEHCKSHGTFIAKHNIKHGAHGMAQIEYQSSAIA